MRTGQMRWVVLELAFMFCAPVLALCAQDAAKPEPLKMMAADADPDWEVTTVRPSDPNGGNDRINVRGRHIVIENESVQTMVRFAYGVQPSQIAGAPDWAKAERWDADGVPDVEGQPDVRQFQSMVRKLLAERFALKLHHEQREMPVFALTLAKGGPKLVPSKGDPNGRPRQDLGGANGRQTRKFTNTSMQDLALMLQFASDRPIMDQTGLKGRYDFQLNWTTDDTRSTEPDAPPGIFTAIQEQIGLKLEPVKAPADVLVVDRVERPGAN